MDVELQAQLPNEFLNCTDYQDIKGLKEEQGANKVLPIPETTKPKSKGAWLMKNKEICDVL